MHTQADTLTSTYLYIYIRYVYSYIYTLVPTRICIITFKYVHFGAEDLIAS